ncbi:MAG: type 4a pilus biogenesis protein PilO [Methylophilaceae bacterium]|nr:type 4a pilus biogenesis protein PilO [Methylophilaceae bacterium]
MEKIIATLAKLDHRLVLLIMLIMLGFLTFEAYFLLLRKPYAEYQKILATQSTLTSALKPSSTQTSEISLLAAQLKQLSAKLNSELRLPVSNDKMTASLISVLDSSATSNGVTLTGVRPLERKPVSAFEEVSFEVSARGSYLPLCKWMLEFENTLGLSAAITEFDIKTASEEKQVSVMLKIALYRPVSATEVSQ